MWPLHLFDKCKLGARAAFTRFNLSEVKVTYNVGSIDPKRVGDLIVRN